MSQRNLLKSRLFLIIGDLIILTVIIAGISIFAGHADIVLLSAWILIFVYALTTKRFLTIIHLLLSSIIALFWVYFARENYGYNHFYITIAGMNILPILAWSLGLIGVSEIFNHFKSKRPFLNLLLFIPLFWVLLLLIETYAFHVIEIRDIMSGNSLGLPFCNCLHAPWWMRIAYFTMGPLYYGLTQIVDSVALTYNNNLQTEQLS